MDKNGAILGLQPPWMNSAGFMGFLPQPSPIGTLPFGAFVTNPISLTPRNPARNRAVVQYPGGFLLHTGHPNPGLKSILKNYQQKWEHLTLPVWPHLLVQTAYECQQMVRVLEDVENVTAIELSLPPGLTNKDQVDLIQAATGELPVFVCIPVDVLEIRLVEQLPALGVAGIVLSAARGMITQNGKNINGRLYGPALFPQLMRALCDLKGFGVPIIAGCGVFSLEQGEAALSAGASAVQLDALCWRF